MPVKLHSDTPVTDIPIWDMNDGDLAIITKWNGNDKYVNVIVQRYGNILLPVGKHSDRSWTSILGNKEMKARDGQDFRVRLLNPGELIEVE